jgi:hypothetical protein
METTFQRVNDESVPPPDLLHSWAAHVREEIEEASKRRWLDEALDREGHFTDTHPTLRARLSALSEGDDVLPPAIAGETASQAWFGASLETLRSELQAQWAAQVSEAWAQRYAQTQTERARLQELKEMPERDPERQIEMLGLSMRLEPSVDVRQALADFNLANRDHALGLYLEGVARLAKDEREGLALLDRVMEVDPEATKAACERAYAFLMERKETELANEYAERWRSRDQ